MPLIVSGLHALVLEFEAGGIGTTITVVKANRLLSDLELRSEVDRYRLLIARELIDDIAVLDVTLAASKKRIATAVAASGTSLCDIYGVGPIGAAQSLAMSVTWAGSEPKPNSRATTAPHLSRCPPVVGPGTG